MARRRAWRQHRVFQRRAPYQRLRVGAAHCLAAARAARASGALRGNIALLLARRIAAAPRLAQSASSVTLFAAARRHARHRRHFAAPLRAAAYGARVAYQQ
jgi:hypothetical protein